MEILKMNETLNRLCRLWYAKCYINSCIQIRVPSLFVVEIIFVYQCGLLLIYLRFNTI